MTPLWRLIADGTWDSGETATVRLTDENLNLNTLLDDDLTKDSANLPVMTFGDPHDAEGL